MTWGQVSERKARLPSDWPARRRRVLSRDAGLCQLGLRRCIRTATEVDHIQSGDDHNESNLQAACRPCHASKSSAEGTARKRELRARGRRTPERHPGMR